MKHILATLLLSLPFTLMAQFNTIGTVNTPRRKKEKPQSSLTVAKTIDNDSIVNACDLNDRETAPVIATATPPSVSSQTSILSDRSLPDSSLKLFHPPLKGKLRITSRFGVRRNPFGRKTTEYHSGLDFSAPLGTPVYSILSGEVLRTGYDSRAGNYITLRHGNFTISYCHLLRTPAFLPSTYILAGQPIAQVGTSGRSTGPHLHLTLKRNDQVIDPTIILQYFKLI